MIRLALLAACLLGLSLSGCGLAFIAEEPVAASDAFQGFTGRLVDFESGAAVAQAQVIIRPTTGDRSRPYYVYSGADGAFRMRQVAREGDIHPLVPGERYLLIFSSKEHRIKRYPVLYAGGAQDLGLVELLPLSIGGEVLPIVHGSLEPGGSATHLRVGPPVF